MIYNHSPQIVKEWKVQGSKPEDTWTVSLYNIGNFKCNCPSFQFKGKFCKHSQAKRLELETTYGNVGNFIKQLKEYQK